MSIKIPDTAAYIKDTTDTFGTLLKDLIPARIGNPATSATKIDGTDRQGLYWIHGLGTDLQSAFPAVNNLPYAREYFIYGLPVLVKKEVNGYVIKEFDFERFPQFFDGVKGAHDQVPVYLSQLMYGTLQPDPTGYSMRACVIGAVYGLYRVKDTFTSYFDSSPLDTTGGTISIPTNNNRARGILVQVTAASGVVSYKQGAEFNAALTHGQAFDAGFYPAADANSQRLGWVRLVAGMTQITHAHIFNAPQIYETSAASDAYASWYFFR